MYGYDTQIITPWETPMFYTELFVADVFLRFDVSQNVDKHLSNMFFSSNIRRRNLKKVPLEKGNRGRKIYRRNALFFFSFL